MALDDAHALVIGISRYQHMTQLGDTQDARDVAAALADPACCGYPPAAVRTLIDDAATRAAILDALDALARDTTASSTVFLYYSGHGARAAGDTSDSYYLVPVDATNASRDELERTAISNTELTARLQAIRADRLTVVLDCCRAAGMADLRLADAVAPLARGRGRAVIAASRSAGAALQLPGERDSMMTGCLVDGLRGAAPGVGGVIRICDLFSYVQQRVVAQPVDQHPVFKAEIEENYPIAQLRGGAALAFAVPPPPDSSPYDAFISYCRSDDDDEAWVVGTLVPTLEGYGLKLCLAERDFSLGDLELDEAERAVTTSRYTIAVFTPAYLADPTEGFQSKLASWLSVESSTPRMIPLIRRPCQLALHARMTALLDASRDTSVPMALKRLALAVRTPPRPRLAS